LESQRAHAYVVGEDLGTVEAGTREALAAHRVLSYRLVWFEHEPPAAYPKLALSAVTTHDLPTIAGLLSGSDLRMQYDLGLRPNWSLALPATLEEIELDGRILAVAAALDRR